MSEIKLNGGEIRMLKAIGMSGTPVFGRLLLGKMEDSETMECVETLRDLMEQGYVISNRSNVQTVKDVECSYFRVSQTHARDLRAASNPALSRDKDRGGRKRRG